MTDEAGYLLDNARAEAGARFAALSAIFDPPTFRWIDSFGIGPGWRCWEVGAGGHRIRTGFRAMLAARGADLAYGRRLPGLLRAAGLAGVAAEAHFPIASPACDLLETATVAYIRDGLVAGGHATEEEIERHLANVAAGGMDLATAPMVSAWGRAQG